jgi:tryptophan 7-halogenase
VHSDRIRSIAIVGGGAAGWLAAATLARLLKPSFCNIRLLDSGPQQPGPISESALPSFHRLNSLLGLNEQDLMQRTSATFKLGAQFIDWSRPGESYFHTFGSLGAKLEAVPFHHHWIRLHQAGLGGALEDYSAATVAAKQGRFARPVADRQSVLSLYSYGYHFHAASLSAYLREYAQAHGVTLIERQIAEVVLRTEDGFVDALQLDDGSCLRADLYIDCTGGQKLPSQQPFRSPHIDWSHWLPCDRALVLPCRGEGLLPPYSQSIARSSGWQWRVPLQHCSDNGYAYASGFISDDQATELLLSDLPGAALAQPRPLRLSPGRPTRFWDKNWLTLAGSTLEPLESTGLHLAQTGIARLMTFFPVRRFSPNDLEEYNRLTTMEHERIRDFLILHYKATTREDSPFWAYCRNMSIPDTLRAKIELFQDSGRLSVLEEEHFGDESWLSVLLGQSLAPIGYDPLADVLGIDEVTAALAFMRAKIQTAVETLPMHARFIEQQCQAHFAGAP